MRSGSALCADRPRPDCLETGENIANGAVNYHCGAAVLRHDFHVHIFTFHSAVLRRKADIANYILATTIGGTSMSPTIRSWPWGKDEELG